MKSGLLRSIIPATLLASSLTPLASGAAHGAGMNGNVVSATQNVKGYRLTLDIGPLEKMYTQADYKRLHPKHGEVMLRGTMSMGEMGMKAPNHHLELHVYDLKHRRVVGDAMVSISYRQIAGSMSSMSSMSQRPTSVPIAVMMGVGAGMSDVHYGNNVYMAAGTYRVDTRVNSVSATFKVMIGRSM
ncbi:MAG TPA: hypothetical protein VFE42_06075 [Chloroflexota bacterium]|nr:hypothetical protein [Chloroflexota bacterium]